MRSISWWIVGVSMLLVAATVPAGAQDRPESKPVAAGEDLQGSNEPTLQPHDPRYQIGIGDKIDISFRFTPEFNQTVSVQPDGYISLRDIPDLRAAGRTVPELTDLLKKRYSRFLHDPVVSITLLEFEKPYFIANGELKNPGKYELLTNTTVLEGVGMAGGFNEKSRHSQVLLFRRAGDQWMPAKILDVKAMLKAGDLTEDLRLRPGDMIFVPKNTVSKVQPWLSILFPTWGFRYPW
jgi:polysaccharide export outer membrane protein